MTFIDGIIEGFKPRFKSIRKDSDRYFDALLSLSMDGAIPANKVTEYTTSGGLWIYSQYIENGYIDAVETDLINDVTDRDFYGALFESTRRALDLLLSLSEHDRVVRIYKAAIGHRLKALKSEHDVYTNPKMKTEAQHTSQDWLKRYLPHFTQLVSNYQALLTEFRQSDPDIETYQNFIEKINGAVTSLNEEPL